MASATMEDVRLWQGKTVLDSSGKQIGTISDVYFDEQTGQPEWALVSSGLFGTRQHFIPIAHQRMQSGQDSVTVSFSADQVMNAPSVDADGELSEDEEHRLYNHYGIDWRASTSQTTYPAGTQQGRRAGPSA